MAEHELVQSGVPHDAEVAASAYRGRGRGRGRGQRRGQGTGQGRGSGQGVNSPAAAAGGGRDAAPHDAGPPSAQAWAASEGT